MKKVLLTGLLLLSLLVANTAPVFAGSAVELISVTNNAGGPTFTFSVNGNFSKNELKGSGQVSGGDGFALHCKQQDEAAVVCHAAKKIGGQNVVVNFGGADFWVYVPEQRIVVPSVGVTQYCYSVWSNSYTGGKTPWADYGPLCLDTPAVHLDSQTFTFPGGITGGVAFFATPLGGCWIDNGPAFYSDTAYC